MDLLRALVLGIVQALTEFLPISSSAHLIMFRDWIGFDSVDGLVFDVALHVGTVCALIVFFRRDLTRLVRGVLGASVDEAENFPARRLAGYIVIATIPAAIAGVLLQGIIEEHLRTPQVIVGTLAAGGALFLVVERKVRGTNGLASMTLPTSVLIGVAQSLALVPGVSRSGITIVAGMTRKMERAEAARFSFLLSVPIMIAAGLKESLEIRALELSAVQLGSIVIGFASSAITGWLVIKYLLRFLQRHRLDFFAYYRFLLAAVILWWLAA